MKKKAEQSMDIDSRDSDIHHYSNKIENVILETIRSYVQPPTYPLTIHKIKQFILEKFGISINKRKIKAYLKDSLNYSYKKDLQDRWLWNWIITKFRNQFSHQECLHTFTTINWLWILASLLFNKET